MFLLSALTCVHAQQIGGTISGVVSDPVGSGVSNASVEVRNTGTGIVFRTTTNEDGFYTAPGLQVGFYEVSVAATDFKRSVRDGITLVVDQRASVDFSLQLGEVSQSVQVTAEAPLVDLGSAVLGKVIENRRIEELPLNGRNPTALSFLTPGVRTAVGPAYSGFADRGIRISTMSINNGPAGMNDHLLDGNHNVLAYIQEIAVPLTVDSAQEFKVQTSAMSAEYGFTAGGVLNLVSKSGSNQFHGSVYEFLRNDALDARNAFAASKQKLRFNQYGGTVGGPIAKNKSFFFFGYEGYKLRQGNPAVGTVPTEAQRRGDYANERDASGKLIPIYDPGTTRRSGSADVRDLFPGNVIPVNRLDPVALRVLELIPLPNRTPSNSFTNSQNYATLTVPKTDSQQYSVRFDHQFTSNNALSGRWSRFDHVPFQKQVIFPGDQYGRKDVMKNQNIELNDTHTFSPTLIQELRIGVVRQAFTFADASSGGGWPSKLGFPSSVPNDVIPTIGITGYTSVGYGTSGRRGSTNWNFQDVLTKIQGSHTLKMGGEYRLLRGDNRQTSNPSGNFSFTSALTGNIATPAGTGSAVASMVLGAVRSATIDVSQGLSMKAYTATAFIQDDWKVTRRLTVNIGLRYDFQQQPMETHDRLLNFDPSQVSSVSGLRGAVVYAGVDGQPRQWSANNYKNFGPRFGFAYDLLGKGTTVLRGGYGVYYPLNFYSANFGSAGTGFSSMSTAYNPAGNNFNYQALQLKDGFPFAPLQPLGVNGGPDAFLGQSVKFTEHSKGSPMAQQWNMNLQHQLPGSWLIEVGYSGNKGTHFMSGIYDLNQLNPEYLSLGRSLLDSVPNPYAGRVPGALGAATITRRQSLLAFPYYTSVNVINPRAGNYFSNLFLLSVEKKTRSGLSVLFSYTGGKVISDSLVVPQSDFGENSARLSAYQNGLYNRRLDRAVDPQDISSRAVISAVYELPFGAGKRWGSSNGILSRVAGGWMLNTIGTMQTGQPLAITGANNQLATRPNSTGVSAALDNPTAAKWFNTAAFVNPPDFTFGNIGRTLPDVRSPGTLNWDLSVSKTTVIHELINVQFRAEMFNFLNHVNLGQPNTAFVAGADGKNSSGSFGVITASRDPRQIQLGMKVRF